MQSNGRRAPPQEDVHELEARTRRTDAPRSAMAREMGGADKVKRQHDGGRLTVRERIAAARRSGSFHEVGALSGIGEYDDRGDAAPRHAGQLRVRPRPHRRPAGGGGRRRLHRARRLGRCVDRQQAADGRRHGDRVPPADRAHHRRLGRRRLGQDHRDHGRVQPARRHRHHARLLAHDRQPGRGAGGRARAWARWPGWARRGWRRPLLGDDAAIGDVRRRPAGGGAAGPGRWTSRNWAAADIQTRSGAIDHAVDTEDEAFACARRFLSYLPPSVHALPPVHALRRRPRARRRDADERDPAQPPPGLQDAADHRERWSTAARFFEMGRNFGRSIIGGLARLEGRAGVAARQRPLSTTAARGRADTCQKITRFVDLAETFHLPVVYLMDCPGFMIGAGGRAHRHHPPRRARDGGDEPDHDAVVHGDRAQFLRRRRRRASARRPLLAALCLAVRLLGLAAARRRHRGRLPRRDRRRAPTRRPSSPKSRSG